MATYQVRRSRMVKDPKTGQMKREVYFETRTSPTASVFAALEGIQAAGKAGKGVKAPAISNTGKTYTKTYSPQQYQTLLDITKAKQAGADPRQFREKVGAHNLSAEQRALIGTVDVGRGSVNFLGTDLAARAAREKELQPELQKIRERRAQAVTKQAATLRRTTGRRALLASPTGGRGFFGGYLKG